MASTQARRPRFDSDGGPIVMFGRLLIYARTLRLALVVAIVARIVLCAEGASADTAEAKKIFTTRCMACHTFGKGVKVGPDLKGVNERRQRDWLLKFVRTSSAVIASGDSTATGLLAQFNGSACRTGPISRRPRSAASSTSSRPMARTSRNR